MKYLNMLLKVAKCCKRGYIIGSIDVLLNKVIVKLNVNKLDLPTYSVNTNSIGVSWRFFLDILNCTSHFIMETCVNNNGSSTVYATSRCLPVLMHHSNNLEKNSSKFSTGLLSGVIAASLVAVFCLLFKSYVDSKISNCAKEEITVPKSILKNPENTFLNSNVRSLL